MKFRVERDVLADAVTWVARGLPARPPVPVLAGILLRADDEGTLTLSAFDYEVSARITVAAEVAEPGTVLVLGRLLADISRNLPDRPIDVATDGSKVQVTCGSSRFTRSRAALTAASCINRVPIADGVSCAGSRPRLDASNKCGAAIVIRSSRIIVRYRIQYVGVIDSIPARFLRDIWKLSPTLVPTIRFVIDENAPDSGDGLCAHSDTILR